MNDIHISVAEVLEVRGSGLDPSELLALAALSAEILPNCPKGKLLFDPDHVYITYTGAVEITPVNPSLVDKAFHPPEWETDQSDDVAAAVYCMGAVLREAGAMETTDADLFSLVNILTVAMIGTRPTPTRMGQMAKNQLKGQDAKDLLAEIYAEIMGDDMENQLSDDYSEEDFDMDVPSGANERRKSDMMEDAVSGTHSVNGITVKRAAITMEDEDEDYEDALSEESEEPSSSSEDEQAPVAPARRAHLPPPIVVIDPPKTEYETPVEVIEQPVAPPKTKKEPTVMPKVVEPPVSAPVETKPPAPKVEERKVEKNPFEDNFSDEEKEIKKPRHGESPSPFASVAAVAAVTPSSFTAKTTTATSSSFTSDSHFETAETTSKFGGFDSNPFEPLDTSSSFEKFEFDKRDLSSSASNKDDFGFDKNSIPDRFDSGFGSVAFENDKHRQSINESNDNRFSMEPQESPRNPFEAEDHLPHNKGTLSGRDPFEEMDTTPSPTKHSSTKTRSTLPDVAAMLGGSQETTVTRHPAKVTHQFSSSDDDIIQADLSDDDIYSHQPTKEHKSSAYFEEIVKEKERPVKVEERPKPPPFVPPPVVVKKAVVPDDWMSTSESENRSASSSVSSGIPPVSPIKEKKKIVPPSPELVRKPDLINNNDRAASSESPAPSERSRLFEKKKPKQYEKPDPNPFVDTSEEEEMYSDGELEETPRKHVNAEVVITQTPPPQRQKEEPKVNGKEETEENLDDAFREAIAKRRASQLPVHPASPALINHSPVPSTESPAFSRRNSLQAHRISGRKGSTRGSTRGSARGSRRVRKTRAEPEFIEKKSLPAIRLKAPQTKRKKLSLHRVEQADVWVELLNGQKVEVSCRTDTLAQDIFSIVVGHMNINEHVFFGLSVMRDGEHFFLDDNQKLEKFAPPGWRHSAKNNARNQYILYLRFRFYPQVLEFVKTDITMHQLYLQLRRDVLEDRLQPKKDTAFELAAMALQVEFGERPPPAVKDYFAIEYYIHRRFYHPDDTVRIQKVLGELHSHYSGTKAKELEEKYIKICQTLLDYGGHLHRVFRSKPSIAHASSPFDPDTGANLWISIMPKGILVQEEQGGIRQTLAEHVWQKTQTLQFDKKKFVIIATQGSLPTETMFYTDHNSKSAYFVRFSASQHRFMIRMRQWKNTLRSERTIAAHPDVAVEGTLPRRIREETPPSPLESAASFFPKVSTARVTATTEVLNVSVASQNRTFEYTDETISNSFAERLESATAVEEDVAGNKFTVLLHKDPNAGLGLTLVDGKLNEVAGVYVKSVADGGAGQRSGLLVGDRLLSVNDISLIGADRHRAVELVKASGSEVRIEISRLEGVSSHARSASGETNLSAKTPMPKISNSSRDNDSALNVPSQKGVSRTPPAPRKVQNKRVRAVSDFGAIGDMLPTFNSEDIIADKMRAISGLHLDESDEERGEYHLPVHSMYSFDHHDDETPVNSQRQQPIASHSFTNSDSSMMSPSGAVEKKKKYNLPRRSNLDWAEDLDEVGEEEEEDNDDFIRVELMKNASGSLGFQIATTSNKQFIIKALTAPPALGHPELQEGDLLIQVNGEPTANKTHQEVVNMLRTAGSRVRLVFRREAPETEKTITVTLSKPEGGSLGLALAKRTGLEGMYIRSIGPNSAAEENGTLRVGDRIWMMDGVTVADSAPSTIVEKLKSVRGPIEIVVKRAITN